MAEIIVKEEIRGMFYENGKLYITMPYIKAIIAYDFQTKKVELLGHYVEENSIFENIIKFDYKIYLFSPIGNDIIYYDMRKGNYIKLFNLNSIQNRIDVSGRKFFETLEYDGFIYAVCRCPNMVICIDPQNDDVQIYHLSQKISGENGLNIDHFPVEVYDNKLVYMYSANIEIEFSLENRKFNMVYLEENGSNYCPDGEEYKYEMYGMIIGNSGEHWIYNRYGKLFKVVRNKKVEVGLPQEAVGTYDDGMDSEQCKINRVLFYNDKLFFILQCDYRVLIYDTHTGAFTWNENIIASWKENRRKIGYFVCTEMNAGLYLLYSYNDWSIYVWDADAGFTEKIELAVSCEKFIGNMAFEAYARYYFLRNDDLSAYLSYINLVNEKRTDAEEKRCGEKIYYDIR